MKHAIFLRGNTRVWNYCKKRNLDFFNQTYNNPDWYVSFWDSKTTTIEQLKQDFSTSNAIHIHLENNKTYNTFTSPISTVYGTKNFNNNIIPNYWRLSYLDFLLTKEKIRYELKNKFEYTSVTFIRPDILYWDIPIIDKVIESVNQIGKLEVFATPCYGLVKGEEEVNYLGDFNFTAGSIASDILGNRFIDSTLTEGLNSIISWDAHHLLGSFMHKHNLKLNMADYSMRGLIVRPNALERNDLFNVNLENHSKFEAWVNEFNNYFDSWGKLSKTEKEVFLKKFKIDITDY